MLKKLIPYKDYIGNERKENFYFNLTETELFDMETSVTGGMKQLIEQITEKQDIPKIMANFKAIILKAYGEVSPDGRRFIKSKELSEAFSQTEAYNQLYLELLTDAKKAAEFITALMPERFREASESTLTPIEKEKPAEVADARLGE